MILAICPTRERVEKCRRMLYSFNRTSTEDTELIFCIDHDDPQIEGYIDLFDVNRRRYFIFYENETITQMFNHVAINLADGFDIYHMVNDDFIYQTVGFDKMILDSVEEHGSGVHYGNDKHWGPEIAVAPFVTADLVKAVGWLQMPRLTHLCGDTVWTEIGHQLGKLFYLPDVVIDHIHPETRGIERDAVTERVNSKEMYTTDYMHYYLWDRFDKEKDLVKCRAIARE